MKTAHPERNGAGSETPRLAAAGAVLDIDLGAVAENYRRLRSRLAGGVCAAVVKADGYGLGARRIAKALIGEGCEVFFVAHLEEGEALRAAIGSDFDIHVLNGLPPGAEPDCVKAGLIPVCNSVEQLAAWREAARIAGKRLAAAVHIDSGMSRLGMAPEEVDAVAANPDSFEGLDLRLAMSHLACADNPAHPANERQLLRFEALRKKLPAAPASLANSSGIFLGGAYHHDLARPGAALYGINPTPSLENPMLPVVRLSAKVIQFRSVQTGDGVGYGHTFQAIRPLRTATISLGYGDGWPRRCAAGGYFEGARLPLVGRVSMDSMVLDVSALAPGGIREGDLVEMIGPHQGVDDVAAMAGTIGYEILTGLGKRFHRRYVGG